MQCLSSREYDCLYWAAQGKTSWEIGCILNISERTANFHIGNICRKLHVRTRQAAITAAIRQGLLTSAHQASAGKARNHPLPRHGHPVRQSPRLPAIRPASP